MAEYSTEEVDKLHYLTKEEEKAIKASIPWELIDVDARELVRIANMVSGIATVQSCAGHVTDNEDGWDIQSAYICLKVTKERVLQILFDVAPLVGILDTSLRYFSDGTFWVSVNTDPAEKGQLFKLFRILGCED